MWRLIFVSHYVLALQKYLEKEPGGYCNHRER